MRSLLAVCLLLPLPLLAAGHEIAVPVSIPSAYGNYAPLVASNGDGFLAVWRHDTLNAGQHVYAARFDADGRQVGASFALLPFTAVGRLQLLAVGSDYALLNERVMTIVSAAGAVIRSFELPAYGIAAANGDRILLMGDTDGTLLGVDGRTIREHIRFGTTTTATDVDPLGDGFLVTLVTGNSIYLQRVTRDGAAEGGLVEVAPSVLRLARSAVRGDEVLVAYFAGFANSTHIDGALVRINRGVERVGTLESGFTSYIGLDVASGADGYALAYSAGHDTQDASSRLYALAIDAQGIAARPPTLLYSEDPSATAFSPSLAANGRTFYAAAQTRRTPDAVAQTTGAAFDFRQPPRVENLSMTPTRQTSPSVTTNGYDFFAAWIDNSAYGHFLEAQLLTPDAARIGPEIGGGLAGIVGHAATAYGDGIYLAVWGEEPPNALRLVARRFTTTGAIIDPQPIVVRNARAVDLALNWNGRQFYAVWSEEGRVWGATIQPDGTVGAARQLGPEPPPSDRSIHQQSAPDVAWDGERYVVVWQLTRIELCTMPVCASTSEVRAVHVSAQNLPLEPADFAVAPNGTHPHIARGGRDLLVTFDNADGVFGTFLGGGAAFPIFRWLSVPLSNVTWDGRSYVAAWRYPIRPDDFAHQALWGLGATRIDENGVVAPFVYAPIGSSEYLEPPPDLASNLAGDTMIVVAHFPGP
ncbi:MAG TPA: hypothetical protein VJ276_23900, partial [Thermoanaerobaculia bacterium]|nr:hypothetical protein [Thermoanaerobaculia bacterium]